MEGLIAGRSISEVPALDLAEMRSWQNFLESALRMSAVLNRSLVESHNLTLVDVRLLDMLNKSPAGSARMGDLADGLMSLPSRVTRQIRLSCSVEVAPDSNNRVELSTTTDALGLPHPKITFTPPDYSFKGLAQAVRTLADMFRLIGATEVVLGDDNAYDGAGHIMGTCRMGSDPTSSVVNAECRTHDHPNLYVAGSSVFPTVGSPNPTLTIAALALKTAQHIATQLGYKLAPQD